MKKEFVSAQQPAISSLDAYLKISIALINGFFKIKAAEIAAKGVIIAAAIGAIALIAVSIINVINNKVNEIPVPIEKTIDSPTLPIGIPVIENQYSLVMFRHNSNAKQLLDKISTMPDKNIAVEIEIVLSELYNSLAIESHGETFYLLGAASHRKGDHYIAINDIPNAILVYNDSLEYYQKAEQYLYNSSNIYFERGKTYSALGGINKKNNTDQANEYYYKAIESYKLSLQANYIFPENAHFALGTVYDAIKKYEEAKESYTYALLTANDVFKPTKEDIYEGRSNANYQLGLLCFERKEYNAAIAYYNDSINDNINNYDAHFELGKSYCYIKQWGNAVVKFEYLVEKNPKNFNHMRKTVIKSRDFAYSMLKDTE